MLQKFSLSNDLTNALDILLNGFNSDTFNRSFLNAKAIEILCLTLRAAIKQQYAIKHVKISKNVEDKLHKIKALLDQEWKNPPDQDYLSRAFGISKSRLREGFKGTYGCSMKDYLLRLRMNNAMELLTKGKLNITQVAMDVGYQHTSNFITSFKRHTGLSPKAFQSLSRDKA